MPEELKAAFERVERQITRNEKGLRVSLKALQTLVIGHYQDVHRLLRVHEREIGRIKDRLQITEPLPPDPDVPRALPDPP